MNDVPDRGRMVYSIMVLMGGESGGILSTLLIMTVGVQVNMVFPLQLFAPGRRQSVSKEAQIEVLDWVSLSTISFPAIESKAARLTHPLLPPAAHCTFGAEWLSRPRIFSSI